MPGKVGLPSRILPGAIAGLGALCGVGALVLYVRAPEGGPRLRFADLVVGITFPLAGAVVARRQPGNRAGWLLVGTGVVALDPLLNQVAWHTLHQHGDTGGLGRWVGDAALWITNWVWAPYLLLPTVLLVLLPTGKASSRGWRPIAIAAVAATTVAALAAMFRPGGSDQIASLANPLGISGATFLGPVQGAASGIAVGVLAPICVGGVFVRQRRATGAERSQLQWLAAGAVGAAAGLLGSGLTRWPLSEAVLAAGLLTVPVAIVIAAWRYGLYDAEFVLNRAVVSFALTGLGLAAYALIVIGVGQRLAPAVAALIAVVAATLFRRAQDLADQLLFGARRQPYSVVKQLGDRLEAASAPTEALAALVQTVRVTLRLPYVGVTPIDNDMALVAVGSPVADVATFVCTAHGTKLGELSVGHRHRGEQWRADERSLLIETARRAGALLHLATVLQDLQDARNHVVAAREEERRRLRRDLHDGVASALAGVGLQLECLLDEAPVGMAEPLARVERRTREVAQEVRSLVEDLRPTTLDTMGLADAIREHAAMWCRKPDAASGRFLVEVSSALLPPLPAATELAAYRIASEAITNAGRHGGARECIVNVCVRPPWLFLSVVDDGAGFTDSSPGGVGLRAMRERATEIGGSVTVRSAPGQGTSITATLPLEIA